jgi:hypothetical protein
VAEQSDTRLELALRAALSDEAAAVPFRIRPDDVRTRARTRRASGTLGKLAGGLAAVAAAVALLFVGASLLPAPSGPASQPGGGALDSLPPFERVLAASISGHELARAEGVGPDGGTLAGTIVPGRPAELVLACSDGEIGVSLVVDGAELFLGTRPCTGGLGEVAVPARDTRDATVASLALDVPRGTAWRAVVTGAEPSVVVDAGASDQASLPAWHELAAMGSSGATEIARASGSAGDGAVTYRVPGLGAAAALEILMTCDVGAITVSFADAPEVSSEDGAEPVPCDGSVITIGWQRSADQDFASEIHVRPQAGTAWEAIVRAVPAASGAAATP